MPSAAQAAEELCHRFQQVFGDLRAFEYDPHKDEERYGDQGLVAHNAVDAQGQRGEERRVEVPGEQADAGEDQRRAGETEGDGKPREQYGEGGQEHRQRQ